jgi:hypothetical protein
VGAATLDELDSVLALVSGFSEAVTEWVWGVDIFAAASFANLLAMVAGGRMGDSSLTWVGFIGKDEADCALSFWCWFH